MGFSIFGAKIEYIFFNILFFLGARKNGVLLLYQGLKQMILHLTVRSGWVICLFYFCKSL